MANRAFIPVTRVLLVASVTVLIAACSSKYSGPRVVATDLEDPTQGGTVGEFEQEYRGTYPRGYVSPGDISPSAPPNYTVVKGDTLWDISGRFLTKPWLWPQIWDYNPQIENPHLIYPGDRIAIVYIDGQPALTLNRDGDIIGVANSSGDGTTTAVQIPVPREGTDRMSPRVRVKPLKEAIPTIPADAIQQFLIRPNVVSKSILDAAPYVVGNRDDRLMSSIGQQVFVRGAVDHSRTKFGIFRKTKALKDPQSGKLLGYEVTHMAEAKLLNVGDPSTMMITSSSRETKSGDVLLPSQNDGLGHTYTPRMPKLNGEGRVVSLVDAITQAGRDQIIVLNLGAESGIKRGDVLAIEARGKSIIDRHGRRKFGRVRTPNLRTGVVMVFQTFDEVSYGLVMESTRPVKRNDIVTGI